MDMNQHEKMRCVKETLENDARKGRDVHTYEQMYKDTKNTHKTQTVRT